MADLSLNQANVKQIDGALAFDTVPSLLPESLAWLAAHEQSIFDFQGTTRCDSAGLAMLIALKRAAIAEQRQCTFRHLPTQLVAIADVVGVADLLQ